MRVEHSVIRWEVVTRLGLVSLTCLLAAGVPYLDLFISLLGALVMATLELIFPVIVYTAVNWSSITWPTLIKVKTISLSLEKLQFILEYNI